MGANQASWNVCKFGEVPRQAQLDETKGSSLCPVFNNPNGGGVKLSIGWAQRRSGSSPSNLTPRFLGDRTILLPGPWCLRTMVAFNAGKTRLPICRKKPHGVQATTEDYFQLAELIMENIWNSPACALPGNLGNLFGGAVGIPFERSKHPHKSTAGPDVLAPSHVSVSPSSPYLRGSVD